jgi:NAD(P)-dependent dehydrogenase (short-subunit alcohol dehydrogenase family)
MSNYWRKTNALALLAATAAGAAIYWARRSAATLKFDGAVVLITGGSRGLGLELAREWGGEGARIAICARTAEDLQRALADLRDQGVEAVAVTCDVTYRSQVKQLVQSVLRRWGRIDVLVNNAGIIQVGPVDCMTHDDYKNSLDTHFWGPLNTIEQVLPHMRRQGGGKIVNIASIGGKISVPHLVPYSAGKFALVGFSEGLAAELASEGIQVTTVCPGLMRTGSPRNAMFKSQHRAEFAWFSICASLPLLSINSRRAARQIVRASWLGRRTVNVSGAAKVGTRLHHVFPEISARILDIVNRMLPGPGGVGRINVRGEESDSAWSPSQLTWLNERAAARNNEIR